MARPKKCRRVCKLPRWGSFGPTAGGEGQVVMTVDEFECLRLIDWEGMTQEQCAAQMMVARATAAAIYEGARRKLADVLVNGRTLTIAGGQVALCPHREGCCGRCGRGECDTCRRACGHRAVELSPTLESRRFEKGVFTMKIAVTYEDGQVFQHFGHTQAFKLYQVEGNAITSSQVVPTSGSGHGALAGFLQEQGVDALICGGIGGGARQALAQAGIALYAGVSGPADQAAQALAEGHLAYDPEAECQHHHDHGEGHHCGHHGEEQDCRHGHCL